MNPRLNLDLKVYGKKQEMPNLIIAPKKKIAKKVLNKDIESQVQPVFEQTS